MPKHRFQRYFNRHGHYPTYRTKQGDVENIAHQLEVTITPTYMTIRTTLYSDPIRIPRRQLVSMLKWAIPLVKQMDKTVHFDPQKALAEQMRAEQSLARDVKAVKAGRVQSGESQAAHEAARARRYRAAQRRARARRG